MIDFAVFAAGQEGRGFLLPHALALEFDTMGIVNEAIQNGIGDGGVRDEVMPFGHGGLSGDDGGFAPVALLDDFEEMEALLVRQAMRAEVVENEQLDADKFVDETREAAVEAGKRQVLEQAGRARIEHGMIEARRLPPDGAGQP